MAQAFNLQAAIQATMNPNLVGSKSTHYCARAVRTFLEYGGLDTSGRPGLARQYTTYLPTIGFTHIGTLNTTSAQTAFTQSGAKPGDIAVYQKPGAPTQPGHICMWNGFNWCSDFKQNHMSVYRSRGDSTIHIFRWTGIINNSPIDLTSMTPWAEYANMAGPSGPTTLEELNGEILASMAPSDVEFKGLWSRYQLRMGKRSPIIGHLISS